MEAALEHLKKIKTKNPRKDDSDNPPNSQNSGQNPSNATALSGRQDQLEQDALVFKYMCAIIRVGRFSLSFQT